MFPHEPESVEDGATWPLYAQSMSIRNLNWCSITSYIIQSKKKTYFNIQEYTKDEASKDKCWIYLSQMVINNCGVENPKPDDKHDRKDIKCTWVMKGTGSVGSKN